MGRTFKIFIPLPIVKKLHLYLSSKLQIRGRVNNSTYIIPHYPSYVCKHNYFISGIQLEEFLNFPTDKQKKIGILLQGIWYNHSLHFVIRRWNSFKGLQALKSCGSSLSLMRNHPAELNYINFK